jgi:hypothetical protein
MNDHAKKEILWTLSAVLVGWGILLFFENSYFAAGFYGVTAPWWSDWVGSLPTWWLDAVDTVMVIVLVTAILLSVRKSHRRRLGHSTAGSIGSGVVWLIAIIVIIAILASVGFTALGLWGDLQAFFRGVPFPWLTVLSSLRGGG